MFAIPSAHASDANGDIYCLAQNIYFESGNQPLAGKIAVSQVVINRVEHPSYPDNICDVIYQAKMRVNWKNEIVPVRNQCQFSWFCESTHRTRPVHRPMWQESELVAKKVLLENFRLPGMKNALYYHADYVNPNWRKPRIDQIGRHIFYGEKI